MTRITLKQLRTVADVVALEVEHHPGYYNVVNAQIGHRTVASGTARECWLFLCGYAQGMDKAREEVKARIQAAISV